MVLRHRVDLLDRTASPYRSPLPGPLCVPAMEQPHVVILGGDFAGLAVARFLARAPVTLLDRRNHHLFQPRLYRVATAALSPGDIAYPIRAVLRRQANARVLMGEACSIDPADRRVILKDGELSYDYLVVSTGVTHWYFGNDSWTAFAPGLKSIDDALEIRRRILFAYEAAERETDSEMQRAWLTFEVVGGGPTGVEFGRCPRGDRSVHRRQGLPGHRPHRGPGPADRRPGPGAPALPGQALCEGPGSTAETRSRSPHRRTGYRDR